MLVDPDGPLWTRDLLQLIYPDSNHTEGIVETSKRTTMLWGSQATDQNKIQPVWTTGIVGVLLCFVLSSEKWFYLFPGFIGEIYDGKNRSCLHTSKPSMQRWTGLPQRRGRRGGRWRWFASELLCPTAAEAGSSGSGWPVEEVTKHMHTNEHKHDFDSLFLQCIEYYF